MSLVARYGLVGALCVAWLGVSSCSKDDPAGLETEGVDALVDPENSNNENTAPIDPDTANGALCSAVGASCSEDSECCERSCIADDEGAGRCVTARFCKPENATCTQAAECCSFACGSDGTCGAYGDLCAPSGAGEESACEAGNDCCSGRCIATVEDGPTSCTALEGAACQSLGERCSAAGSVPTSECCSGWCVAMGTLSDGASDLRCGIVSECRSTNDICDEGRDCCSGVCNADTQRCVAANTANTGGGPGALRIGEPCAENNDCFSETCASNYPSGPKVCQRLGGCTTRNELCEDDTDCCLSEPLGLCNTENPGGCVAVDGTSIKVCRRDALPQGRLAPGEVCGTNSEGGSGTGTCCGAEGAASGNCRMTIFGTNRCFGFRDTDPLYGDGDACVFHDQCESNLCLPDEDEEAGESGFRCEAEPRDAGEACTVDIDCVSLTCDDFECQPVPAPGTAPLECRPLGASCDADDACCSSFCNTNTNTCAARTTLI